MNSSCCNNLSAPVASSQRLPHKKLHHTVKRYMNSNYRNSIPKYARDEFKRFRAMVPDTRTRIILDSGCGTGESTMHLADANPQSTVVGVDKSNNRMRRCYQRNAELKNLLYVRCDLIHFWRLLRQAGYKLNEHYILYPNPWPKPGQLQRRWHAHPVFPAVVELGGLLTMRTNWRIYAEEFALALRTYTSTSVSLTPLHISLAMTAFERKYTASGHALYEVQTNLTCARTHLLGAEQAIPPLQHYA